MRTPSLDKVVLSQFYPVPRYNDTTLCLNIHEKQSGSAEGRLHNPTNARKNDRVSTQVPRTLQVESYDRGYN